MDEIKPGSKTTELWVTVMGVVVACIVAVVPIIMEQVAEGSTAYVILGAVLAIATTVSSYAFSRGKVKAAAAIAKAATKDP